MERKPPTCDLDGLQPRCLRHCLEMNERYIKWWTPYLSRDFEMLAFGDGSGLRLILFPTSFGRYYQNKDFGLVGSVAGYVDSGRVGLLPR